MPAFEWYRVAGVCGFIIGLFLPWVWLTSVVILGSVLLVGYSNRLEDKDAERFVVDRSSRSHVDRG